MPRMKAQNIEKLGFLIHDVARLMRKRLQERGSEYGLSAAQWRLLFQLLKDEGVPQARLAGLLEIEPISVSRLIDRMAEAGWVERRIARTDRRVRMVFATPRARAAYGAIKEIGGAVYEDALAGMSDDERLALVGALQKMADNLGGAAATPC
nr:MarR family transcriptional regulator [Nitratireductor soli]